ncbi:hypothetical protein RF11_01220 [Thelohanellus kitauei]|uniref:Uncharacterized protein n=1 Tax=Thelohanellus kitauei TaxID=669202 RepID=A0A0C2M5N5_THEKT|nr:hypothetical protein RF11_02510 [Thelohanellus kitauei]KII62888.1 hypothetical protein RF11_01220 [Thelohanellus kitauei]
MPVAYHIKAIDEDLKSRPIRLASSFQLGCLTLYDSHDIDDCEQLFIFLRGIILNMEITEELMLMESVTEIIFGDVLEYGKSFLHIMEWKCQNYETVHHT